MSERGEPRPSEPAGRVRGSAALAVGFGVALLATLLGVLRDEPAALETPVSVWAADQDGDVVIGLDADLLPRVASPCEQPLQLAPAPEGGVWVLEGTNGGSDRRLLRLDAGGRRVASERIRGAWSLHADRRTADALLVRAGGGVVLRRSAGGERRAFAPGTRCGALAGRAGSLVAGDASGLIVLRKPDGATTRRLRLDGAVQALEAATGAGGWWVVLEVPGGRLVRISPELALRFRVGWGPGELCVAAAADRDELWLADGERAVVARIGAGGRGLRVASPELVGALALASTPDGGVLVATSGAILRFDALGERRPGQGGFRGLADLCWVGSEGPAGEQRGRDERLGVLVPPG